MKTEDGNETLHPWIEPELEARLTALVLGEASDFERDELERLIEGRPELGLYRKRLETMHRLLREVAKGESVEEQGEWKLSAERRQMVLARLSGQVTAGEKVMVMSGPKRQMPWGMVLRIAACVAVIALVLGLMFPASTGALRKAERPNEGGAAFGYFDRGEKANRREGYLYFHDGAKSADAPPPMKPGSNDLYSASRFGSVLSGDRSNAESKYADVDGETREFATTDLAIRPAVTTSATPAPPADPMAVDQSGPINVTDGTVALGAGGDFLVSAVPNQPAKLSVISQSSESESVRLAGELNERSTAGRGLERDASSLGRGGTNTYTGATTINAGTMVITNPEPAAASAPASPTAPQQVVSELRDDTVGIVARTKGAATDRYDDGANNGVISDPSARERAQTQHKVAQTSAPLAEVPVVAEERMSSLLTSSETLAEDARVDAAPAKGRELSEKEMAAKEVPSLATVQRSGEAMPKVDEKPLMELEKRPSDDFGTFVANQSGAAPSPAAKPMPVTAAPASGPVVKDEPAIEQQLSKVGAGTLALNGGANEFDGVVDGREKLEASGTAPAPRGNKNRIIDLQVPTETQPKVDAAAASNFSITSGAVMVLSDGVAANGRPGGAAGGKEGSKALGNEAARAGAGTRALGGGTVELDLAEKVVEADGFINHKQKADAPVSAPTGGGNFNFTGDFQVNGGAGAKANATPESLSLASGGVVAGAAGKNESDGSGNKSPAKLDALSRTSGSGGGGGQEGEVSQLGRLADVEKSMGDQPGQEFDREAVDKTKDQVIRRELPLANSESGIPTGTVSFGAGVSQIDDMADFKKVGETDLSLPIHESLFRSTGQTGTERKDEEADARTNWSFGRSNGVDKSVQDILALTPMASSSIEDIERKEEKLKNIIIPSVEFNETPLKDALKFLQERSVELDLQEPDPSRKGIQIIGDGGLLNSDVIGNDAASEDLAEKDAGLGLDSSGRGVGDTPITLRLSEVPLAEALRYTTSLAQLKYRVEPGEVRVVPLSTPDSDLYTSVYTVPPTFLSMSDIDAPGSESAAMVDPFANPVTDGGTSVHGRSNAKNILERSGITFPPGSTAVYNSETSQLIVRNTQDQIELVEAYIESIPMAPVQPLLRQPAPAALGETSPETEPFSTFSLHVSDVSFQLAKAALASGKWPEVDKIRIEEFVNAFDYGDPMPGMGERVTCRIDQAAHPFLQQRNLVRIALRTAEAGRSSGTPLRLTLLLDSSGSMERPDRRETLIRAVATLAGLLGENDRITLVSFARQPRLVADAVAGNEAMKLAETVAALPSEGGTNLEAALELAFEKAREHQEPNAQNRIVLLTDGAANLGDAKAESLGARVEMMREAGIAFDAAGFGAEGLNDEILEALTRKGDGRYYLLDRPEDAGEAFAEQIAGALRPAAKNVKVQVEFNSDRVKSYKLLGFEKHRLATEDFRNDAVDAAEMAAAEAGVAVYQVEPDPSGQGDLGSVSVRFQDLDSGEMIERRWALPHLTTAPSAEQGGDAILLATVASQFAAKLAGGPIGDVVDLTELASLAAALPESERANELRTMIEQARGIEGAK